jgi:hypothetical protein
MPRDCLEQPAEDQWDRTDDPWWGIIATIMMIDVALVWLLH